MARSAAWVRRSARERKYEWIVRLHSIEEASNSRGSSHASEQQGRERLPATKERSKPDT
jgi:hypothetical protein